MALATPPLISTSEMAATDDFPKEDNKAVISMALKITAQGAQVKVIIVKSAYVLERIITRSLNDV